MFKKSLKVFLFTLIIFTLNTVAYAGLIDTSLVDKGIVKINNSDREFAVRINKDGEIRDHILDGNGTIPLISGQGNYHIMLLERLTGNEYTLIEEMNLTYQAANENDLYLQKIENINWNDDMEAIKLSRKLTEGKASTMEKVQAIYTYITSNIKYDYVKAENVTSKYNPNIDQVLLGKKGICYDYSVLMAAMLRSQGIPTKVVEGYAENIDGYHAWNSVYIQETGQWITVDVTSDSIIGNSLANLVKTSGYTAEMAY